MEDDLFSVFDSSKKRKSSATEGSSFVQTPNHPNQSNGSLIKDKISNDNNTDDVSTPKIAPSNKKYKTSSTPQLFSPSSNQPLPKNDVKVYVSSLPSRGNDFVVTFL